jgi:hypothetical protein
MFDILEYDDAQEDVKEIYNDIFKYLGNEGLVDYFKVLGKHNKNILAVTYDLLKNVLINRELPSSLKKLAFVAVPNENNCLYCTHVISLVITNFTLFNASLTNLI